MVVLSAGDWEAILCVGRSSGCVLLCARMSLHLFIILHNHVSCLVWFGYTIQQKALTHTSYIRGQDYLVRFSLIHALISCVQL